MRHFFFLLLLSASFVLAQDDRSGTTVSDNSNATKGQVTVQGCLSRAGGDLILMKVDPGRTYELRSNGKVDLVSHLGQRVEVVGDRSPSTSTSSDATAPEGSPSSVTITVTSITTIEKECPLPNVH